MPQAKAGTCLDEVVGEEGEEGGGEAGVHPSPGQTLQGGQLNAQFLEGESGAGPFRTWRADCRGACRAAAPRGRGGRGAAPGFVAECVSVRVIWLALC